MESWERAVRDALAAQRERNVPLQPRGPVHIVGELRSWGGSHLVALAYEATGVTGQALLALKVAIVSPSSTSTNAQGQPWSVSEMAGPAWAMPIDTPIHACTLQRCGLWLTFGLCLDAHVSQVRVVTRDGTVLMPALRERGFLVATETAPMPCRITALNAEGQLLGEITIPARTPPVSSQRAPVSLPAVLAEPAWVTAIRTQLNPQLPTKVQVLGMSPGLGTSMFVGIAYRDRSWWRRTLKCGTIHLLPIASPDAEGAVGWEISTYRISVATVSPKRILAVHTEALCGGWFLLGVCHADVASVRVQDNTGQDRVVACENGGFFIASAKDPRPVYMTAIAANGVVLEECAFPKVLVGIP